MNTYPCINEEYLTGWKSLDTITFNPEKAAEESVMMQAIKTSYPYALVDSILGPVEDEITWSFTHGILHLFWVEHVLGKQTTDEASPAQERKIIPKEDRSRFVKNATKFLNLAYYLKSIPTPQRAQVLSNIQMTKNTYWDETNFY